jgi:hypothetical protein
MHGHGAPCHNQTMYEHLCSRNYRNVGGGRAIQFWNTGKSLDSRSGHRCGWRLRVDLSAILLASSGPTPVTVAVGSATTRTQREKTETAIQRSIRILLWKSMVGSILIVRPTTANMIQFVITRGRELGMICLSICMVDCTSSVSFSFKTLNKR